MSSWTRHIALDRVVAVDVVVLDVDVLVVADVVAVVVVAIEVDVEAVVDVKSR